MSLFVGKDAGGSSVFHLSSGTTDITDLKSGVLSNTVMHSSLPMVLCTVEPLPVVGTWSGTAYGHVDGTKFSTTTEFRASVNAGTMLGYIGVDSAGVTTIISMRNWNGVYTSIYWVAASTDYPYQAYPVAENSYPSDTYPIGIVESIYSEVYCIISNIDFQDGYIPFVPTSNSITITRDTFSVRGQDLRSLVYLANGTVNTVDYYGTTENTTNTLQFVNSVPSTEPFTVYNSSATGVEYIDVGTKRIFDTSYNSYSIYSFSESVSLAADTYTFSGTYDTVHTFTLASPISNNSVIVIGGVVGASSFVLPGFGVYNGVDRIGYLDYYDGSIDGYTDLYNYTFEGDSSGNLAIRFKGTVEDGYTVSNTTFDISIHVFS